MVLFTLLAGAVMGFATGSIRLGSALEDNGQREASMADLLSFIEEWVEAVPRGAEVEWSKEAIRVTGPMLLPLGDATPALVSKSELRLAAPPPPETDEDQPFGEDLVLSVEFPSGESRNLVLFSGLDTFAWELLESRTRRWVGNGKSSDPLTLVGLRYGRDGKSTRRHVFELPPTGAGAAGARGPAWRDVRPFPQQDGQNPPTAPESRAPQR